MLTIFALQLCPCFGVDRKKKKPGTNMREVFQAGSLATFTIRKNVTFKPEEDQPQLMRRRFHLNVGRRRSAQVAQEGYLGLRCHVVTGGNSPK